MSVNAPYPAPRTLRAFRAANGLRQADLARLAGCSRDTVRRIESGRRPLPVTARAIAEVFGVPVSEIFAEEVNAP